MDTIEIGESNADSIQAARNEAVAAVGDRIENPVVLSWRDEQTNTFAPDIPGAEPKERWRDYGTSFGGKLEVAVGDRFHFIIGDASGYSAPDLQFTNVTDDNGRTYLCLREECGDRDRVPLGQTYAAGGGVGG